MDKRELLILGGVGAIVVVAVAIGGRTSSSGVAFSAPNPASVAAVENSAAAQIASHNATIAEEQKNTLGAIVQLASIQQQLTLGRVAAGQSEYATEVGAQTTDYVAGLQSATSIANTSANASAAVEQARIGATASEYAAQVLSQAQQAVSANQARAQIDTAQAQKDASQAASHASQQNGFWGAISGIVSGVSKAFAGGA